MLHRVEEDGETVEDAEAGGLDDEGGDGDEEGAWGVGGLVGWEGTTQRVQDPRHFCFFGIFVVFYVSEKREAKFSFRKKYAEKKR